MKSLAERIKDRERRAAEAREENSDEMQRNLRSTAIETDERNKAKAKGESDAESRDTAMQAANKGGKKAKPSEPPAAPAGGAPAAPTPPAPPAAGQAGGPGWSQPQ